MVTTGDALGDSNQSQGELNIQDAEPLSQSSTILIVRSKDAWLMSAHMAGIAPRPKIADYSTTKGIFWKIVN